MKSIYESTFLLATAQPQAGSTSRSPAHARGPNKLMQAGRLGSLALATLLMAGCTKGQSFSLLADSQTFQQNAVTVNNKIDVLWVVDNSGSMDPFQKRLVDNFSSFISNFQKKGFDFQIGVTTSDAYLAGPNFYNDAGRSQIRDGAVINAQRHHTGFPLITPSTPDALNTFVTNATQGSAGSGDERAFQSLVETLNNSRNAAFKRPGSFLAVIILSDEDDFSDAISASSTNFRSEGGGHDQDYAAGTLMKVGDLVTYLDALTSSTASLKMYNVSTISVQDTGCQSSHAGQSVSTVIGKRYSELATKTNGIIGNICDDSYANSLDFIQQRIVELTTQFVLQRAANPNSLHVTVNGKEVPQDATNGWSYNASSNSISFHGSAVPEASAGINVTFTPTTLK